MQLKKMFGGKSPGITILWVWTLGTAAVLVTNVVRTRLRDMENLLNDDQPNPSHSTTTLSESPVDVIIEDES